ncbi:MAG: hypothetical protein WBB45_09680 [Cyclobacteriaceae bacterium]
MAVTSLKRKARKNRVVAKRRQDAMKRLNTQPVIKQIDIEEIKKEFAGKSGKKADKKKEEAPKAEKKAEKTPKAEVKEETPKAEEKKEESSKAKDEKKSEE